MRLNMRTQLVMMLSTLAVATLLASPAAAWRSPYYYGYGPYYGSFGPYYYSYYGFRPWYYGYRNYYGSYGPYTPNAPVPRYGRSRDFQDNPR